MKSFQFRMQTVLDLRSSAEKNALREVAIALNALEAAAKTIREIKGRRDQCLDELGGALRSSILDPLHLVRRETEVQALDAALVRAEANQRAALERLNATQEEAQRRRADRKAFETLRDQARSRHDEIERREEGKVMDDIAAGRYCRSGASGRVT